MPHRVLSDIGVTYELISFDKAGVERADDPDGCLTAVVLERLKSDSITDLFCCSHGWKGDLTAAKDQYDAWIRAMFACKSDRARAQQLSDFRPLVVGIHWPSQPWGDEEFDTTALTFTTSDEEVLESQVDMWADRIADTPVAREALRTILANSAVTAPPRLPTDVETAYIQLHRESGLQTADVTDAPGTDHREFDPQFRYQLGRNEAIAFSGGSFVDGILSPLRQLSFWKMKDRARLFGESGAASFLRRCLGANPDVRIHLMGHSFGCIVMSAAVAGPQSDLSTLSRPVQSLTLIQGALSLWTFCADIPFRQGQAGYFRKLVAERRVAGPILTTQSRFDTAVGTWYPLAAGVARQVNFADDQLPQYGAVGSFGVHGPELEPVDLALQSENDNYNFRLAQIYNLECSNVIRTGGGASGAHSDICHPELGHAVWSAALAR